jgi:hypothetical protein
VNLYEAGHGEVRVFILPGKESTSGEGQVGRIQQILRQFGGSFPGATDFSRSIPGLFPASGAEWQRAGGAVRACARRNSYPIGTRHSP